jgi:transcriptional regulator with XRE-family HTH domain
MVERPPVGAVIRSLRRGLKLTQNELALRCGLTAQYLSLLELGQVNVSLDTLVVISAELGQPLSAMLLEAETMLASKRPQARKRKPTA